MPASEGRVDQQDRTGVRQRGCPGPHPGPRGNQRDPRSHAVIAPRGCAASRQVPLTGRKADEIIWLHGAAAAIMNADLRMRTDSKRRGVATRSTYVAGAAGSPMFSCSRSDRRPLRLGLVWRGAQVDGFSAQQEYVVAAETMTTVWQTRYRLLLEELEQWVDWLGGDEPSRWLLSGSSAGSGSSRQRARPCTAREPERRADDHRKPASVSAMSSSASIGCIPPRMTCPSTGMRWPSRSAVSLSAPGACRSCCMATSAVTLWP